MTQTNLGFAVGMRNLHVLGSFSPTLGCDPLFPLLLLFLRAGGTESHEKQFLFS